MHIAIINGPNLNLLGQREPHIYGNISFGHYLAGLQEKFAQVNIEYFQSNIEGELINYLHQSLSSHVNGIILNAGAYTHTSIAIADALSAITAPAIEVHISNVLAREDYRKTSYIAGKCIGSISGLGLYGYDLALEYFIKNQNAL